MNTHGRDQVGDLVNRAARLAERAHAGQYRRDGVTPYLKHPEAVATRVAGDPLAEAAAWLHDVLEDTPVSEDDMRDSSIPEEVIACVVLLTKKGDIDYEKYLRTVKEHPLARKVKIADMLTNLGDRPSDRQIIKYAKGLLFLMQ